VQSQWSDTQQPTRGIDAALAHRTDHDATPSVAVTHGAYDGLIHRRTHQTHVRSLVRNDDRRAFDISQQVRVLHDLQPKLTSRRANHPFLTRRDPALPVPTLSRAPHERLSRV
jgi:hypothetical protein